MLKDRFSTRDVLQLTGITARQLQWWDERRIVVAQREGRNRVYSACDLLDILVIEELRRRHISLAQVRRVLRFLRMEFHARFADLVDSSREQHLLLDGKRIYLRTDPQQVVDLLRNTKQAVMLICLTDTVRRLNFDVQQVHDSSAKMPAARAEISQQRRRGRPRASDTANAIQQRTNSGHP
jgi:DNA-binding transcriptional MerR regulator